MRISKNGGAAAGASLPGNVQEDCHENIRRIVEYWTAIRPCGGLPGRQHFDPLAVPELLPNIRLLDVSGAPPRFRVRLMGTRLRDYFGIEQTGRWLDEIFPKFGESQTRAELIKTIETRVPRWRLGKPALEFDKNFLDMERVYLPFARDGERVDMILTYLMCITQDGVYS
ncbi:MAG: PAS domain-containing protein [Pseudomonadota bacterium]